MARDDRFHMTHHAMGSPWDIDVDACPPSQHESLTHVIKGFLDDFESTYSRFKQDSFVSQLRHTQGRVSVPKPFMMMVHLCFQLSQITHGVFNPCIAEVLEDMGYDASYSLTRKSVVRNAPLLTDVITIINDAEIELACPVAIDFGAVGKGCAVDLLIELLTKKGYTSITVNGSGDMKHVGSSSLRVGLEHPENPDQAIGICMLNNRAIASSGSNRRTWGKQHHIIDPHTLQSPEYIRATWVVAESAMCADALATTLFLIPPDVLRDHFDFEYVLVNHDMQVVHSPGWQGEVFS